MILFVGGPRHADRVLATDVAFELLGADMQYVPFTGNNEWLQAGLTYVYIWNQSPDAEFNQRIHEEIEAGEFEWPTWPEENRS